MDPTTYLDVYDSVIAASLENKISEIPALQMLLQLKFLRFHHCSKQAVWGRFGIWGNQADLRLHGLPGVSNNAVQDLTFGSILRRACLDA